MKQLVCLLLFLGSAMAQSKIEVEGRWSDNPKGSLVSSVVNCYRAAKICTVVSANSLGYLQSDDSDIVRWDSEKVIAIGGGDCVTNTLVINVSRKAVSVSSASNHEKSKDGACQRLDEHPDWMKPATLIQPPGGWFLIY